MWDEQHGRSVTQPRGGRVARRPSSKQSKQNITDVLAGGEGDSRVSQVVLKRSCERVRASKHAPRGPFNLLERIYGLAELSERGGGVIADRSRVIPPRHERGLITFPEDAPRHGQRFRCWCGPAEQWRMRSRFLGVKSVPFYSPRLTSPAANCPDMRRPRRRRRRRDSGPNP